MTFTYFKLIPINTNTILLREVKHLLMLNFEKQSNEAVNIQ